VSGGDDARMERYEVRIAGRISPRRAAALGCELERTESAESLLVFVAVDQTALYGLVSRLRDAGLGLIAINPRPGAPDAGAVTGAGLAVG
jgi:hypothetical protein